MLKVLVIGGGGREHAIVHALKRGGDIERIWCAPGNAGISQDAECLNIPADDIRALCKFALENQIDITMVGPEAPLVDGIVDYFRHSSLRVIGPPKIAARLEGSKSYAKEFMHKYGIPTARHEVIPNLEKGAYVLAHWPAGRCVMKADGLAAGKGVKVCESTAEAKDFLYEIMHKEVFGASGSTAVLEEYLDGEEATIMAFCDGKTLIPMPASQDHKRLLDHDAGPNTGGMGAYAPAPLITPALLNVIEKTIFEPFMKGIEAEHFDYRGIIYFGLMITSKGPIVLEFNVRFGDPETQTVLPLLETDLAEVLLCVADQTLADNPVRWSKQSSLCIVAASGGYPGTFEKGKVIHGLPAALENNRQVYHAGTVRQGNDIVTAGGRVLGITAQAETLEKAQAIAYELLKKISFDGMVYRKDIGARALVGASR